MSEPEGKRRYIAIVSVHNASYNEMHTSNILAHVCFKKRTVLTKVEIYCHCSIQ